MKKILVILLSVLTLLCVSLAFACDNGEKGWGNKLDWSIFKDEYSANYGEIFYFDYSTFGGKELKFEVKNGGKKVSVVNGGFIVDNDGEYSVSVRMNGDSKVYKKFKVTVMDSENPNVALSEYVKFVAVGDTVELPTVSISDNKDENVTYTVSLTLEGEPIEIEEGTFIAEDSGEYKYKVTAKDSDENESVKECLIVSGTEFDKSVAIAWSQDTDVVFHSAIHNTKCSVDSEQVWGGFKSSYKIEFNTSSDTTCVTLENSLIKDISEYDYILFYVMNDMTSRRQISFNWTSVYAGYANVGTWTPFVFPISEDLVTASYNSNLSEYQDWKNLNGMRIYIQNSPAASGSMYFSDIYLLKDITEDKYVTAMADMESAVEDQEFYNLYKEVDADYYVLKYELDKENARRKEAEEEPLEDSYTPKYRVAYCEYIERLVGEDYNEKTLVYSDRALGSSQLIGAGDQWSMPYSVGATTEYKYGEEKGSIKVTFPIGRTYANLSISKPSVSEIPENSGLIEFYVLNKTGKNLEMYTDHIANNAEVCPISDSEEWQRVVLSCDTGILNGLGIYLRTRGESEVVSNEEYKSIYISNVNYVEKDQVKDDFNALALSLSSVESDQEYIHKFMEMDRIFNALNAVGEGIELRLAYDKALEGYIKIVVGDKYEEDRLTYVNYDLPISQPLFSPSGDFWTRANKVSFDSEYYYEDIGDSKSIKIEPQSGMSYSSVALGYSAIAEIESEQVTVYVLNKTGKPLEMYARADGSIKPSKVAVGNEWQEVTLTISKGTFNRTAISIRTEDGKGLTFDGGAIYISSIKMKAGMPDSGIPFDTSTDEARNFFTGYNGSVISKNTVTTHKYNGQNDIKIALATSNNKGTSGATVDLSWANELMGRSNVKSLTITFMYKIQTSNAKLKYMYFGQAGNEDNSKLFTKSIWEEMEVNLTSITGDIYLGLSPDTTFSATSGANNATFYIADFKYQLNYYSEEELTAFKIVDSTSDVWHDPALIENVEDVKYGEEGFSTKLGIKAGEKYAIFDILTPSGEDKVDSGIIKFYIKNATGKALDIYTGEELEASGNVVISINSGTDWQEITLHVNNDGNCLYAVNLRGAGETVVDSANVSYVYISLIKAVEK